MVALACPEGLLCGRAFRTTRYICKNGGQNAYFTFLRNFKERCDWKIELQFGNGFFFVGIFFIFTQ